MTAVVRRTAPRALALVAYVAAAAVGVVVSVRLAGGQHVFPLDDAYIHLSIARTLAEHGTYGLQPGAFATPASSLAWPLLLAGASRLGLPLEGGALVLSLLAGGAALLVVDEVFLRHPRYAARPTARGLWLAAFAALVPLLPMGLLGMEHALHITVVVALVGYVLHLEEAASRATLSRSATLAAALLAAAATSLRYESLFVVAALAAWLLVRRRRSLAAFVVLGAVVPLLVAAAFFAAHGAPLMPASVVLKRARFTLGELPALWLARGRAHPHAPALLVALALAAWRSPVAGARPWLFVAAVALACQATFAQLGWLFRYESYAVALAVVGLALSVEGAFSGRAVVVLLLVPLGLRAASAHAALPRASRNIAEQQREVARLVAARKPQAVAVNDVGAVSYFGQSKVLDLMGLADLRVAAAKGMHMDGRLPPDDLARLAAADGVELAVLYERWFEGALPGGWVPVLRLRIRDNHVCAFDTVTLYAVGEARAPDLRAFLERYRPSFSPRVEVFAVP